MQPLIHTKSQVGSHWSPEVINTSSMQYTLNLTPLPILRHHFRFGLVVTLLAARSISPGDEVTVNYNYSLSVAPDWYKQCLLEYNLRKMTENKWCNNIFEWGSKCTYTTPLLPFLSPEFHFILYSHRPADMYFITRSKWSINAIGTVKSPLVLVNP